MKHNKNKKGFTIVELVIVIGVIGILAGILIPTFVNVTQKAEEAAAKSDVANAFSSYVADAADGIVEENIKAVIGEEPAADTTYYIELIKQEDAVLVRGDKEYVYTADKGWDVSTTANKDTDKLLITAKKSGAADVLKLPTYGGVKIYQKVAA